MASQTLLGRDLEVLESIRKHLLDDPDVSDSFPTIFIPTNNPIWEWDTNFANIFVEESSSVKASFDLENKGKNDIDDVHGRQDLEQHAGVKKRSRNYSVEKKRPAKNAPAMWLEKCNGTSDGSLAYDGTTVRFRDSGTK